MGLIDLNASCTLSCSCCSLDSRVLHSKIQQPEQTLTSNYQPTNAGLEQWKWKKLHVCFGVSIVSSIAFTENILRVMHCIWNSIYFASATQGDDRLKWLIRYEFLCYTHPIIKALLWYYVLPVVSLSICVGLHYCCTSKPPNEYLHTSSQYTQTFSLSHTHIQRSWCVWWLTKVFIFVLQEDKETRYQEWRPTHTMLRSATPWYINVTMYFTNCGIIKAMCNKTFVWCF